MINTYIISGFLGAGKTTFIQHLLSLDLGKTMLLENEFGEVGVDANFFDKSLAIKEINNGCICCSLQGDFESALNEIASHDIDTLIIEPSGVGKLSEIIPLIINNPNYRLLSHACVVNGKTSKKYHKNFKEFFDDQVVAANVVILSHIDVSDEATINDAKALVHELNDEAVIIDRSLDKYSKTELLDLMLQNVCCCSDCLQAIDEAELEELEHQCCHHHNHDHDHECCHHHEHDHECCHHHDEHHHHHHHGDEVFESLVIRGDKKYSRNDLENILGNFDEDVIRVKGYALGENETWYFNYVLNEYHIFAGKKRDSNLIVIIGSHLDHSKLEELF